MSKDFDKELIIDGLRLDGRIPEQLRDVTMNIDVVTSSNGSAKVSFGHTTAIVSVQGPRSLFPKFLQNSQSGILRVRYNMLPFSVSDRKSPGPDRRSTELSKVIRKSLEPSVILNDYPKVTIDAFIEMIEADGSTRVTGINALSLALADAGIPMRDLVAACSVGKINNILVLDLAGIEDNNSESDVAVAMMPNKNLITLLQMDGMLTKEEFIKLMGIAKESCVKIAQMQKVALLEKFKGEE